MGSPEGELRKDWGKDAALERRWAAQGGDKLYADLSFSSNILTLYLRLEQRLTEAALTRGILSGMERVTGRSTFSGYRRPFPIATRGTSACRPNTSKLPSLSTRLWYSITVIIMDVTITAFYFSRAILDGRRG